MSERPLLAEHCTAFGLAIAGFAAGGAAAVVAPAAVITAVGLDRWSNCDAATLRAVQRATLEALEQHPDIPNDAISAAASLLKSHREKIRFDTVKMTEAVASGDAVRTLLRSTFGDLSTQDPATVTALLTGVEAAFDAFRKHTKYREAFTQEMVMRLLADHSIEVEWRDRMEAKQDAQIEMLEELLRRTGGGGAALADPEALSLDELQALAANFGEAMGATKAELVAFIQTKRQEHEAFVAEINAINEQTAGLGNLKAAAKAAADKLDYAEVEHLLSMVHTTEIEIAAQTAELRADNALLRNRPEEAYRLLSAAAESFAPVDELEPSKRKLWRYTKKLLAHGQRYGGKGIALSIDMTKAALPAFDEHSHPRDFWAAQVFLGNALGNQGARTGGAEGAALLGEAVTSYRAALRVYTEAAHPVDWAMTQNNLGIALWEQGKRLGGAEGAALLAEAVTAYRAALRVYTEAAHPVDWAQTQNNLGAALRNQSTRLSGPEGAALLGEVVTAYRAALRVRTEVAHPVDWAMTQNNLAIALSDKGTRLGGAEGATLLSEAVTVFRAALRVRTEAAHPVQWAITMKNIALAEESLADAEGAGDSAAHLRAALDAVTSALRVFDPEHMAFEFEQSSAIKSRLEARLAGLG